jgi:ribonuclease P protein component
MLCFNKRERLCLNNEVEYLFKQGNSFLLYPFSIRYIFKEQREETAKILIVCPKRYQKHAVDRNRIKRLIRESYRKNKQPLITFLKEECISIDFSITYVSKDIMDYHSIENKIQEIISTLISRYDKK